MLFLPPAGHRDSAAHPPPGRGNCGWALRLRSTAHLPGHPHLSAGSRPPRPGVAATAPLRFRQPAEQPLRPPQRSEMPRILFGMIR